jgi:hypothetical protein
MEKIFPRVFISMAFCAVLRPLKDLFDYEEKHGENAYIDLFSFEIM